METPPLNPRHAPFHLLDARVYFPLKSGTGFTANALRPSLKSTPAMHTSTIFRNLAGPARPAACAFPVAPLALQRLLLHGEFVGRPSVLDLAVDTVGRIAVSGEVVDCARSVVIVQPAPLPA